MVINKEFKAHQSFHSLHTNIFRKGMNPPLPGQFKYLAKKKKSNEKLNYFLSLSQILMKLQTHKGSDYFPCLLLLKFPEL